MSRCPDISFAFMLALCCHGVGGIVFSQWIAPQRSDSAMAPLFKSGDSSVTLTVVPADEIQALPKAEEVAAPVAVAERETVEAPAPEQPPIPDAPPIEPAVSAEPERAPEASVPSDEVQLEPAEPLARDPGREADAAADAAPPAGGAGVTEANGSEGNLRDSGVETVAACDVDIRPRYPLGSRLRGEEGATTLRIRVGAGGRADDVKVETSSGYTALDRAAVSAISRASFKPRGFRAKPYGDVLVSIRFQLVD